MACRQIREAATGKELKVNIAFTSSSVSPASCSNWERIESLAVAATTTYPFETSAATGKELKGVRSARRGSSLLRAWQQLGKN
jgi:hypothetical protein